MKLTELIIVIITSGIAMFLLERLFFRRKDKAETKGKDIENAHSTVDLYREIDAIVERKTAPIISELNDIKAHWCCYRKDCDQRILYGDSHCDGCDDMEGVIDG